jgi:CDP-glucose 4,6-dehydratase
MQSSFWQGKKVLVTGATGLVGSWLTKELIANKAKVTILTRDLSPQSELVMSDVYKQTQIIRGALESYETVERAVSESECDTIIHLAAQAIVSTAKRSPLLTFESNIRGTYHILEAARLHKEYVKAVVFASSDKAYGSSDKLPYFENMPLAGEQPYEVSKSCGDLICQSYFKSYNVPVAIARCGNIYGGGDLNFSRIIPGTIKAILLGEQPIIRSDGTFVRDYIYVKDTVQAYLTLAKAVYEGGVAGEAFNFSPEVPVSVIELVSLILEKMNAKHLKPIIKNIARGEIHDQYLDSSKARKKLKWHTSYSLIEGINETIEWYRKFLAPTGELAKTKVIDQVPG